MLIWILTAGCGQSRTLALGVTADDAGVIDRFAAISGAPPAVYQWYQGWEGQPAFDTTRADAARSRGALPLLTWEPWVPGRGAGQPQYALSRLVDGSYDSYVTAFARQVKNWDGQLGIRFMHELNAPFYPWGANVNGNSPAEAIAAWRHVRTIFDAEGADNVVWVWCVNVQQPGYADYASLYPGDDTVDWVAVDGYNGGDALPWGGWRTPEQVFGSSFDALKKLTDRPLAITEVASVEQGGDKARWVSDLFGLVEKNDVCVLIWFEYNKEADWRVESSAGAAAALRREATVAGRLGPAPIPARVEDR
jgi:beta-mannanase